MIYTCIWAFPLLLLCQAIDAYLFIAGVRLIATRINGGSRLAMSLPPLTDGIPLSIQEVITRCRGGQRSPLWIAWLIVIVTAYLLRQLLVLMIVSM